MFCKAVEGKWKFKRFLGKLENARRFKEQLQELKRRQTWRAVATKPTRSPRQRGEMKSAKWTRHKSYRNTRKVQTFTSNQDEKQTHRAGEHTQINSLSAASRLPAFSSKRIPDSLPFIFLAKGICCPNQRLSIISKVKINKLTEANGNRQRTRW